MENITLGFIKEILVFLAAFITAGGTILVLVNKVLKNQIIKNIEPLNKELKNEILATREDIKEVKTEVKKMDIAQCQNFLVRCFNDLENGLELDETIKERMGECYDHYTQDLKQNSYIHKKWDKLMK